MSFNSFPPDDDFSGDVDPTTDLYTGHDEGDALVLHFHGQSMLVCYCGPVRVHDVLDSAGRGSANVSFEDAGMEARGLEEDGAYVGKLSVKDDGPGDWPGTRECVLVFHDARRVTAEEWRRHLDGEWPWEMPEILEPEPAKEKK